MKMAEWFLAELESEAAKSRRVLEQVPTGKRDWKPHERSMAARLPVGPGREHSIVGRHGHHAGRAGYRAERRTEIRTGTAEYQRGARCGPRQGRGPGARGPAEDHRRAPRDILAPPGEWSSRARAAASPRDSRYVPALGASPWTDDGLLAPAGVEGAFSVWADCRRPEFRMT